MGRSAVGLLVSGCGALVLCFRAIWMNKKSSRIAALAWGLAEVEQL